MKKLVQTLSNIKNSILKGNIQMEKPILIVFLNEALSNFRVEPIQVEATCSAIDYKEHFVTYRNHARRYKNKVNCEIQDLIHEIERKDFNEAAILTTIERLVQSNLYMDHVEALISRYQSKNGFVRTELLTIK